MKFRQIYSSKECIVETSQPAAYSHRSLAALCGDRGSWGGVIGVELLGGGGKVTFERVHWPLEDKIV